MGKKYIDTDKIKILVDNEFVPISNYLDNFLFVDSIETKCGEWKQDTFNIWCSNCGVSFPKIGLHLDAFFKLYSFCPNCGVNMRSKTE